MENSINLNIFQLMQFVSVLLTGMLTGLFYGYDCSVIKGLGNLTDIAYLQAFQSINKMIQNPYFFVSFLSCLIVLPLTTWLNFKSFSSVTFYLLFFATLVYVVGVFGITVICNVPLNEQLAKFSISTATPKELSTMRKAFENPWNFYHKIRTIASLVVFSLSILSIIINKTK